MATITNDYTRCELLNLGSAPNGRGPFIIRQTGSPPDSMTLQQDPYLLRKDGVWVINLAVFSLSEEDQSKFLYSNSVEAITALNNLLGKPLVESHLPVGVTREQALAGAETTASRLLMGIKGAKSFQVP